MKGSLLNAGVVLVCIVMLFQYGTGLENSEFSGGSITGVLLRLYDAGLLLFVPVLLLTLFFPRIAAVLGLFATLLSLPVFLYVAFPATFRYFFPGNYSVPLIPGYFPDKWTILGLIMLAMALLLNVRTLSRQTAGAGA